ncbi:contractile injection system protein, VgrG/Pvc8 family [Pantoea stewartii]|uniref:contractile injection system protein, VgrG/Pvc8 family n=1 Tax=Pantoea stewartii TaxID=66269 RepID=UPI00138FEF26|nr:contractile injection system protein, VgrG/Pvc8 family [Pantoea stewartii]
MGEHTEEVEFAPAFSVTAEGKDITRALRQSLAELTLTDYGGATEKTDEVKITLLSETLALPSKGARLRVALGFNETLTDKGWFVVSRVGSSGPPRRIEIYATAAPMNAEKQRGNVTSQKTRSWDSVTLSDIVKTIAADNGLVPKVASELANEHIEHLDQVSESDANFISRLARSFDAVSKPSGGYWLFLKQGAAQKASGNPAKATTVTPDEVSTWSYSEGERGSANGEKGNKKEKISVRYYDEADGKTKTAVIDHNGPALANPYTQPAKKTAEKQAKAKEKQSRRYERKMTLSGPCRPQHIALSAESGITTTGFGTREDKTWIVESLVFTLTSAGLSFTCNLVADIRKKSKKKEKKSGPDYYG